MALNAAQRWSCWFIDTSGKTKDELKLSDFSNAQAYRDYLIGLGEHEIFNSNSVDLHAKFVAYAKLKSDGSWRVEEETPKRVL